MDFFEDEIPKHGHDWKAMVEQYLFEGPNPLINNIICGRQSSPPSLPFPTAQPT